MASETARQTGPSVDKDRLAKDTSTAADLSRSDRPSMSDQVHIGAETPQGLLRQMSLPRPKFAESEPTNGDSQTTSTDLDLSGNIISVTFCVPYSICLHDPSGNWIIKPRRGPSALFDSLSYLASARSKWRHHLVAWTGEIDFNDDTLDEKKVEALRGEGAVVLGSHQSPSQAAHRPRQKKARDHASSELSISSAEMKKLQAQLEQLQGGRLHAVCLSEEEGQGDTFTFRDQGKWRRYGEQEILTFFHSKPTDPAHGQVMNQYWKDYVRMNEAFADRIFQFYTPGDIILIHDYHLFLLPKLLRQRVANAYIGFFLHIPFPDSEYYRCLTKRKEILQGVLAADVIGFQTKDYAEHFARSCRRIMDITASWRFIPTTGGHVAIEVCAIGINTTKTWHFAFESQRVGEKLMEIKVKNQELKIVVGWDRPDSVHGVAQKLRAFELFLEKYPEWVGKVILVQVTSPTSTYEDGGKHDKTNHKIMQLVNDINRHYGNLQYQPVDYHASYLDKEEYFAVLRMADAALITSVRDGMNTAALEYIVCQHTKHAPLVISEFSGTTDSLADAIKINPWDTLSVAEAINMALTMSDGDKTISHDKLYKHVTENNVEAWTDKFIQGLITDLQDSNMRVDTPVLDIMSLLTSYHNSQRRLFMFDYDGTLTPIVSNPTEAKPTGRLVANLKALVSDKRNSVWIVSGRDQDFLQNWMGDISALGLSAEHGCFMRYPESDHWSNLTEEMDLSWQDQVEEIFGRYTDGGTDSTVIERKRVALTWHYRNADPAWSAGAAKRCLTELRTKVEPYHEVEVMRGKMNLEVRPRLVNKGEIAKRLIGEVRGDGPPDFVVSAGDDHTDEDMFRALKLSQLPLSSLFAVTVGKSSKHTLASYHLEDPANVIDTIEAINNSGLATADGTSSDAAQTVAADGACGTTGALDSST